MRIASFQITFKLDKIREKNLKFDERFGANAKYKLGEENIFLYDAIRNKLRIYFVNKKIGTVDQTISTWFNKYDEEFFRNEGACFYRISKILYPFLIFQYGIRKYRIYRKDIGFKDAIKNMKKGAKEFTREESC